MKHFAKTAICLAVLVGSSAWAQTTPSALSCADFRPTPEALERFPNLRGACEAVVERNGELYGQFKVVVRTGGSQRMTVYIPATDKTVTINPDPSARVLLDGRKVRPRDLRRGDEVSIYLSVAEFAEPAIDDVFMVTDADVLIEHDVVPTAALPTTASPLPALLLSGLALMGIGAGLRTFRSKHWGKDQ